jgi:IS1 family transposase
VVICGQQSRRLLVVSGGRALATAGGGLLLGQANLGSCVRLWQQLPREYAWQFSLSDQWHTYGQVFDYRRHQSVEKKSGQTAHVERWFNTLRQRLARLTRKSLAFSKSKLYHQWVTAIFIHDYNLSRIS